MKLATANDQLVDRRHAVSALHEGGPSLLFTRLPVELALALRYLRVWRALATCLLLSGLVVGVILFGADLIFALRKWVDSPLSEIIKSAARLGLVGLGLLMAVGGLIRIGRGHSSGIIMGIAVFGVTVGVAVLIVVLAVMTGFGNQLRDKILGLDSHIVVSDFRNGVIVNSDEVLSVIRATPHVVGAAPYVMGHVVIEKDGKLALAVMKGINPAEEKEVSALPSWIIEGNLDVTGDGVVIGHRLARQLRVSLYDKLTVYSPKDLENYRKNRNEAVLPTELEISGIFSADVYEFDAQFIFVSLNTAREMYVIEEGAQAIGVKLENPWKADVVRQYLQEHLPPGLLAETWAQRRPPIFDALRTEKVVMFFILLIITIVAAFGIASTLFTVSIQKTREIGLLQSLGATRRQITAIFVMLGAGVGACGTLLGIAHGLLALRYRNDVLRWLTSMTDWELFPAAIYNFSQLPAAVSAVDVLTIAVSTLVICTLAGVAPAIRSARLNAVEALRYE